MKIKIIFLSLLLSPVIASGAVTVTESTTGALPVSSDVTIGQSFAVPSGTSYQNIRFSWIGTDGTSPLAFGNLFLMDQEYLGTPRDLSSSTAGFVGQSSGISAGEYLFTASLTLNAGSSYWAYTAGTPSTAGIGASISNPYGDGVSYTAPIVSEGIYGDYAQNAPEILDVNFKVSSVPEPSSVVLLGLGGLALMLYRRK